MGNRLMRLHIYLMRHGQKAINRQGLVQGWADSPLTEEGKADIVQSAQYFAQHYALRFDAAFCSTLARTQATAQLFLDTLQQGDLPIQALDDLREYHFGSFEGQPSARIHQTIAQELGYGNVEDWLAYYRSGKHSNNQLMHTLHRIDPRAEQESQFIQRLHRGIQHIIANSLARSAQGSLKTESSGEIPTPNVLIVSHGMAITALLRSVNPQAIPYRSVPNASATLLRYNLIGGLQIIGEAGKALP